MTKRRADWETRDIDGCARLFDEIAAARQHLCELIANTAPLDSQTTVATELMRLMRQYEEACASIYATR